LPDITGNTMRAVTLDLSHAFTERMEFVGNGFYRSNSTAAFNGDTSPYTACALGAGHFLLDGLERDALGALGLGKSQVCDQNALGVATPRALQTALNTLAGNPQAFALADLTPSLTGTGVLADGGINNQSALEQETFGTDLQWVLKPEWFGRDAHVVGGFNYFAGRARFNSLVELAALDPVTRSTEGLGVGTFISDQATQIRTASDTWSFYALANVPLTTRLTLTAGGRFNHSDVQLRDQSGLRPELNGDHGFERFNPTVGATYEASEAVNFYASYSESARAPTPIELSCNEGVFDTAKAQAVAAGQDPSAVNVECRLPNAFLADPPLKQVVADSVEAGVRGVWGDIEHRLG
jgi:outer membrane receptor protein involved in Fe transport